MDGAAGYLADESEGLGAILSAGAGACGLETEGSEQDASVNQTVNEGRKALGVASAGEEGSK